MNTITLIEKLNQEKQLEAEEWVFLIENRDQPTAEYLCSLAQRIRQQRFGNRIYTRGLIEFTNYCKNNCYYCGIRRDNQKAERYRLTQEQILECCRLGYELGFRTFVLQGGEDGFFDDARMEEIVRTIRRAYADCAITLSLGECSYESYQRLFAAGADRYLLRHETADEVHYGKLHPPELSAANRKQCLYNLKKIGYQTGTGFMVGAPGQTAECLAADLDFIRQLNPQMVGIGPFVPHHDTPFVNQAGGTLELTLYLLALLRVMLPDVLLPATTALGTIDPKGRELGILAGANVVMPNLSPVSVRKKYELYDNKICTGDEAAECRQCLARRMESIGCQLTVERGDYQGGNCDV